MSRSALSRRATISAVPSNGASNSVIFLSTLPALHSDECSTSCPTDSTEIPPGLGSLSGRAIRSLGEATLRRVDHMRMLRRFSVVTSSFPLRDDAKHIPESDIIELYDDLLEFSRVNLYPIHIQEKALRIIIIQIAMRQTNQLITAIARWNSRELHVLLQQILIQLLPLWNPTLYLGILSNGCCLYGSYVTTIEETYGGQVSAIPFILFISKLVRIDALFCQIALEIGILDVLTSLCRAEELCDQKVILCANANTEALNARSLLIACNALLFDITSYTEYHSIIRYHPITSLWPVDRPHYRGGGARECAERDLPTARQNHLFLDHTMDVSLDHRSSYLIINLPKLCKRPCISKMEPAELLSSLKNEATHRQACRIFFLRFSLKQKEEVLKRLVAYMMQVWHQSSSDISDIHMLPVTDDLARFFELMFEISRLAIENRQALRSSGFCTLLKEVLNKCISDGYLSILILCRPKYFLSLCKSSKANSQPSLLDDPKLRHFIGVRSRSAGRSETCTCTCRQLFQYSMALLVALFEEEEKFGGCTGQTKVK